MVVPLLLRGLNTRVTATKRQAAMSIDNMSKLVDDPVDARPLIPLLMPAALEYAAETLSDPEARGCAGACYCWYASVGCEGEVCGHQ